MTKKLLFFFNKIVSIIKRNSCLFFKKLFQIYALVILYVRPGAVYVRPGQCIAYDMNPGFKPLTISHLF